MAFSFAIVFIYTLIQFKRALKKYLFFLFVWVPSTLFAQYDYLFELAYPQRYIAIDSAIKLNDNAYKYPKFLKTIDDIRLTAIKKGDKGAELQAALHHYDYLIKSPKNFPFLDKKIDSLIAVAEGLKLANQKLVAYMNKAWTDAAQKKYAHSFEYFLKVFEEAKTIKVEDFPDRNYYLYAIALQYYKFADYEKAIEIGRLAKNKENWIEVLRCNIIAMSFQKIAAYDSSRHWHQITNIEAQKTILPPNFAQTWDAITAGNQGITYYLQNNFEKASPLLQKGIIGTEKYQVWDNVASFSNTMANIYLKQNQLPLAKKLLEKAQMATYKAGTDDEYFDWHKQMSVYHRIAGNVSATLMHQDSMLYYQNKISTERSQKLKVQAEYKHEQERKKLIDAEINLQKWIRNGIIIMLFLGLALALLYYNKQKNELLHEQKQLAQEKALAEENYLLAQKQLDEFTKNIKEKNNLIESFSAELEKLQNNDTEKAAIQNATLNQIRKQAILTDDDWETFRITFDKVHTGYLHRLKAKLPYLSPAETRFMALAKLQLNTKEMGNILGVSPSAIRTTRSRMRKHLNLTEEGDIEELVNSI